ncbi:MAG: hypothetical protein HY698_03940 [Deltaproteobacteria bacterium]|nr:hypothetical protein [Deltaproteobacteria bacterium]
MSAMIMPSDIVETVYEVLTRANRGKGARPRAMTAYAVLDRLPLDLRDNLIHERGMPGKGSGSTYSAAQVVSDACEILARETPPRVKITYHDCEGERYRVADQWIEAGYSGGVCARYRAL